MDERGDKKGRREERGGREEEGGKEKEEKKEGKEKMMSPQTSVVWKPSNFISGMLLLLGSLLHVNKGCYFLGRAKLELLALIPLIRAAEMVTR